MFIVGNAEGKTLSHKSYDREGSIEIYADKEKRKVYRLYGTGVKIKNKGKAVRSWQGCGYEGQDKREGDEM